MFASLACCVLHGFQSVIQHWDIRLTYCNLRDPQNTMLIWYDEAWGGVFREETSVHVSQTNVTVNASTETGADYDP